MRKFLFSLVFIIATQISWSQSETSKHTVADGESLYSISKKYNTSVATLIDLNPSVDDGIKTGMELVVPVSKPIIENKISTSKVIEEPKIEEVKNLTKDTAKADQKLEEIQYHTITEGETYYSISKKYKTSVTSLMELNNNAPVKMGEKLIVAKKIANESVLFEEVKTPKVEEKVKDEEKGITEEKAKVEDKAKIEEKVKIEDKVKLEETKQVTTEKSEVKVEKYTDKTVVKSVTDTKIPKVEPKAYTNAVKKILIIPFDPYLYWSDADMEIAKQSKLEHTKVRQAFRRRLNALLEPAGYETIHLLGGRIKDSLTDLNKIYKNVKYAYQDAVYNPNAQFPHVEPINGQIVEANKNQPVPTSNDPMANSRASLAKDEGKYYGVKDFDPNFFPYFNNKYEIDYYIFVNQFEVKTNYTTCLDRATQNYERSLITHFSIYDNTGKRLAGSRIKVNYHSNQNNIQKILTDNMQQIANQIIGELPKAK